jgi:hypothetical protein
MFRVSLTLAVCSFALLTLAACGGGDDSGAAPSSPGVAAEPTRSGPSLPTRVGSTGGTEGGPEPVLSMPVSRFALSHDDIPAGYIVDLKATWVLNARNYGGTSAFPNAVEGENKLKSWGYLGGYETGYEPEQRQVAVLTGSYYVNVETHLFETVEGAKEAYAYFEKAVRDARSKPNQVTIKGLANDSSAWQRISDKVPNSDIDAVLHWFIFRRGNMIGVVKTYGAAPFMSADIARDLAVIIDEKALGARQAVEPTAVAGREGN